MPAKKAPYLARFKKGTQGLVEFATLVEQAEPSHREMILQAAEAEDPRFLATAMKRVVFFDELQYLDETVLAELLSKISPKILAFAMRGTDEDFRAALLKQLGFREQRLVKDEEVALDNSPESFVLGARRQILKTARLLESQNKFIFEVVNCPRFEAKKKKA